MTSYPKSRSPGSNTRDPAFWARFEPHRYAIRPDACNMGDGHTCWVRRPYEAISRSGLTPHCTGCGGAIVPVKHGQRLAGLWPEPVAAILSGLERGER